MRTAGAVRIGFILPLRPLGFQTVLSGLRKTSKICPRHHDHRWNAFWYYVGDGLGPARSMAKSSSVLRAVVLNIIFFTEALDDAVNMNETSVGSDSRIFL